ncbi:MAG: DNA mismatch endonuclease Vsr [Acidobacteria bacterium]|nr:DNA mismatch endonuclease Vsr [Acidobacteriota bacterium]MBI3655868.1 DNA mismatch endonuclease Vsr [Acidobacteriota bacterium]
MTDTVDRATRSRIMAKVLSKNTSPELAVRRAIHSAGHRFQLYRDDLPGRPDLVFPRHKLAVFVHGCFWHGHNCKRFRMPSTHSTYWKKKIHRNKQRDKRAAAMLRARGWKRVVIWECKLAQGIDHLRSKLALLRRGSPRLSTANEKVRAKRKFKT